MNIDVSDSFTLTAAISNPSTNLMLQLATIATTGLYIHYIDISQTDNTSERAPAIQLVNMVSAATMTNVVDIGVNLLPNDLRVPSPPMPLINSTTSGATFSSGGSVGDIIWTSLDFDIRIGPLPFFATSLVKPIYIPPSTTVGLRFSAAPSSSHTWRPKIGFAMEG